MYVESGSVLSDPLKIERLYRVLGAFLDGGTHHPIRSYDSILQSAKAKAETGEGMGSLRKYVQYSDMLLASLPKLKGKRIVFINGVSTDKTENAKPGRSGVDPFSPFYGLSEDIIGMFRSLPDDVKGYVKDNIIFWPIGPFDFPFTVEDGRVVHCLRDEVTALNDEIEGEGRIGFGSLTKEMRQPEGTYQIGNYQFNERLFDMGRLKKSLEDNPSMYVMERQRFEGTKPFLRHLSKHTALGKWLLAQKYASIAKRLGLQKVTTFFTRTSYAREVFDIVAKETGIGLDNVLRSKKEMTFLKERDPTYINQLMGRLQIWANDAGIPLTSVRGIRKQESAETRVAGGCGSCISCSRHPLFRCEYDAHACSTLPRPRRCTADFIDEFMIGNREARELFIALEKDAKRYAYGVLPIEMTLLLLNSRDHEVVVSRRGRASLMEEIRGRIIVPFPIRDTTAEGCELRASEFGSACPITGVFSRMDKDSYPAKTDTSFAEIGTALHWMINQQPPEWKTFLHNKLLTKLGIPAIPRQEYCERSMVFDCDGVKVSGHPDGITAVIPMDALAEYGRSLAVPRDSDIFVQDIKRGMYSAYEKIGYRKQLLCYALGIRQNQHMTSRNLYLNLIKTPFDSRRFLRHEETPIPERREEAYRNPRYSIIKVPAQSEEVDRLVAEIKERAEAKNRILHDNRAAREELMRRQATDECGCGLNRFPCFDKPICDSMFREMGEKKRMIDVIRQYGPYPAHPRRSELFGKDHGQIRIPQ
ncbi:Uncharacterised protein [uncultured archaeon]|nr:Uncharacterised protein [uncultured archaeon]